MNNKTVKILGVGLTIVGAVVNVAASFIGEKQQELKITEKVAEAIAKTNGKES